jgi:hypothetical protein
VALQGSIARSRGDWAAAGRLAIEALQIEADHVDALVLRGWVALREGHVAEARDHALWALREAPSDRDALTLLVAIKARTSVTLGLWWRLNAFLWQGSSTRAVVILIVAFLFTNLARQLLSDGGYPIAADGIQLAWLGLCVYSWVGPSMFQAALERELAPVQLDPRF